MTQEEINRKRWKKLFDVNDRILDLCRQKKYAQAIILTNIITEMYVRKAEIILKYLMRKQSEFPAGGIPITGGEEIILPSGNRYPAPEIHLNIPENS